MDTFCKRFSSRRAAERQAVPPALHAASQLRCKQLIPVGSHQQPFLCADSEHPCLPGPVHGPGDFPQGPFFTKQLP